VTGGPSLRLFASAGRKKFARNLYAIRAGQSLSEADFADRCCFPLRKVRALERAAAEPDGIDLVKLASVLDVSVNFLLTDVHPRDFRTRDRPTPQMLTEIEEGHRDPGLAHIVVLARALEVLPSALFKAVVWRGGVLYYNDQPVEE
jgi:transcriptional regulator with XRE-family HTH domain